MQGCTAQLADESLTHHLKQTPHSGPEQSNLTGILTVTHLNLTPTLATQTRTLTLNLNMTLSIDCK